MNESMVEKVVQAVLYEGYMLYPYRPSVKNRHRWTFGGVYPPAYAGVRERSDACSVQTECLVRAAGRVAVEVKVRFLHLMTRTPGELAEPLTRWPDDAEPAFRVVESLRVGDQRFDAWQEAVERQVAAGQMDVQDLVGRPQQVAFAFAGLRTVQPVREAAGAERIAGVLLRQQEAVAGRIELAARPSGEGLFTVTVRVVNDTALEEGLCRSRDAALMRSLVSAHTVLGVKGGEFVSLMDVPSEMRQAAAQCRNVGTWPVLVGAEGQKDTILSSPIVLYDYPQIAPESPGELFDGTEIDELLTLRILTLTDQEKQEMAAVDGQTRELLRRTEAMAREQLSGLHGAIRSIGPVSQEQSHA